jgi:hypothetical protein
MYKKIIGFNGERDDIIQKIDNGLLIPFDPANTDYQEYLKWVEEGNTPEPAETE